MKRRSAEPSCSFCGVPTAFITAAAAGIGRLGIVDFDVVDYSNLQRQVLHDTASIGSKKTESARARLRGINPHVEVDAIDGGEISVTLDEILDGDHLVLEEVKPELHQSIVEVGTSVCQSPAQVRASAFYVENWQLAHDAVDYFAASDAISPVQHYWSLSGTPSLYSLLMTAARIGFS